MPDATSHEMTVSLKLQKRYDAPCRCVGRHLPLSHVSMPRQSSNACDRERPAGKCNQLSLLYLAPRAVVCCMAVALGLPRCHVAACGHGSSRPAALSAAVRDVTRTLRWRCSAGRYRQPANLLRCHSAVARRSKAPHVWGSCGLARCPCPSVVCGRDASVSLPPVHLL